MSSDEPDGIFRVTGHYALGNRGAFVLGSIAKGSIRIGMLAKTGSEPITLKISGIEQLANTSAKQYCQAFIFAEQPSMELITRVFPVGRLIELK